MLAVIILAAGRGTRMKSSMPKILHKVAGVSMVEHVLRETKLLNPQQQILVLSPELSHVTYLNVDAVIQDTPKGSAHAVMCAMDALKTDITDVIICCGDTPLLTADVLRLFETSEKDINLMLMDLGPDCEEYPYGRVIIENNSPVDIVEMKDATPLQKKIPFANSGVYKIKRHVLDTCLKEIRNDNAANEYYLTDILKIGISKKFSCGYAMGGIDYFSGVNTRCELSVVEKMMQQRLRRNHMLNGVTLINPDSVVFHMDTKIGQDVTINPFVTFGPGVVVENNVEVFAHCHIENSHLKANVTVGPFAHLRGNTILHEGSSIGNFVEVKGSVFEKKAKAKHLSYIGDAEVGGGANIGAGTITCNYNGFSKSKTTIGDGAFIGSNSSLVAPVIIGQGAIVAAGSVITKDVDANDLSITRSDQRNIKNWAERFRAQYKKVKT
jgi:bifunctional UDP-N-acetylglucosamine pyrophosphorylase/glucosamine-1-phosphate N-acetyltransferase